MGDDLKRVLIIDADTGERLAETSMRDSYIRNLAKHSAVNSLSKYFCLNTDSSEILKNISGRLMSDFIFLSSHINYDNVIVSSENSKPLNTALSRKLIGDGSGRTIKALQELELIKETNGKITVSDAVVSRGGGKSFQHYVKIRDKFYQNLYVNSGIRTLTMVGLLFRLAPYINHRWNIVASVHDIYKLDRNVAYKQGAIAELMGISKSNISRTLRAMTEIVTTYEGTSYRLAIYGIKKSGHPGGLFINPYIMSVGDNFDDALDINVYTSGGGQTGFIVTGKEDGNGKK